MESLPLKLMIIAVVASLSIIPAADALESLRNREYITRAELQLEMIVSTAQILAIEGPGGVRTIPMDFSGEGSVRFYSLTIGDSQSGPNMSSAILTLTTGAKMVKIADEPPVWMRAADGRGTTVDVWRFSLRMSAQIDGTDEYVLVEVV